MTTGATEIMRELSVLDTGGYRNNELAILRDTGATEIMCELSVRDTGGYRNNA